MIYLFIGIGIFLICCWLILWDWKQAHEKYGISLLYYSALTILPPIILILLVIYVI